MYNLCPACSLNDPRGSNDGDDACLQCLLLSSCDEFQHHRSLAHIISICRTYEQAAKREIILKIEARRRRRYRNKWLLRIFVLSGLLAFTFLMGSVGKEDNVAQDYDADVFLPSKALRLLGVLLFWTVWLLLNLLKLFLWLIKGLLWFISISASPLCHCLSYLLSCVMLLLQYTCNAVFFATTSPVYVCVMLLTVFSLLVLKYNYIRDTYAIIRFKATRFLNALMQRVIGRL
ncbi:uncharacterized protein LOC119494760 [Sebastes umbrosus]|uniref:uncharacterized protein LOC119494760 n=1 Tax=Sebastes umbrosus TaxID=72105 RepID=UPI0018A0D6C9|nr:uncharacterized protein LOC119494760 [Sebastes umbrosus]